MHVAASRQPPHGKSRVSPASGERMGPTCGPCIASSLAQPQFVPERWQEAWPPPTPLARPQQGRAGGDGKLFPGLSPGIPPDLVVAFFPRSCGVGENRMSSFRVQKPPHPRGLQPQGCRLCPEPLALYVADTEGEGGDSNNGASGGKCWKRPHSVPRPQEMGNKQDPAGETPHPTGSAPCQNAQHVAGPLCRGLRTEGPILP